MKATDRQKLIDRIKTLEGLTDDERSALLGLLRESKPYGLVGENKTEVVEERLRNGIPVLIEDKSRALTYAGPDAPSHILIKGNDLEALSILAYTHSSRIDVIHMVSPSETDNEDCIYNDSSDDRADCHYYYHFKWLYYMSRRLRIAEKLLSERGVMFISIHDNESAYIKLLCEEIFGEGQTEVYNFNLSVKEEMPDTAENAIEKESEYVIACYKSKAQTQASSGLATLSEEISKMAKAPDSVILDFLPASWATLHMVMQLNAEDGGKRSCILCASDENDQHENEAYEWNKRVIQGYTGRGGKGVSGLHDNNLRYYRTDLVGIGRPIKNRRNLAKLFADIFCIKENIYVEKKIFAGLPTLKNSYRYFEHNDRMMLFIYDEGCVDDIVRMIASAEIKSRIKVYIFSPDEECREESFKAVNDKAELCCLPRFIEKAYN